MTKRTEAANWARTLAKLRRWAEIMRAYDFQIVEPPSAETPPSRRGLPSPPDGVL